MKRFGFTPRLVLFAALVGCKPPPPGATAPRPVANAMPAAERVAQTQAAKDGKRGAAELAYCVDTSGIPQNIRVLVPLEPEFDALAKETVASWRFEPATQGGVPVEQCTEVRIELR